MKISFSNRLFSIILTGLLLIAGLGCKKNHNSQPSNPSSSNRLSDEDSLKYYIYHYMLVTITEGADTVVKIPQYLWYKQVTASINPFSPAFPKAEDLLNYMISFPQNPSDRYSFLDRTGQIASQIQNGQSGLGFVPGEAFSSGTTNGDMGFEMAGAQANNQVYWFVIYVYKNSSAGQQGSNGDGRLRPLTEIPISPLIWFTTS